MARGRFTVPRLTVSLPPAASARVSLVRRLHHPRDALEFGLTRFPADPGCRSFDVRKERCGRGERRLDGDHEREGG
jgi:hypothetical protein